MAVSTISVVLSVYNGEQYLRDSVTSILRQTYQGYEFIIINDGSTDRTSEILNTYKGDPRIRVVNNPVNIGLTRSLNKAISTAQGRYIARMDVDDISLPERFQKQLEFMERSPDIGVVGTSYYDIEDDGKKMGEIILPIKDNQIRRAMTKFNPFNHSSVMIRSQALKEVGSYDEKLIYSQDYELWFRILNRYRGHNLPEKLLLKRNPKGSITVAIKRKQLYYSLMAWRMGRRHISNSIMDYRYYLRLKLMYLIPSFMIPILRNAFTRQRCRRQNRYYVVNLVP